jgi:predicted RNase H-like nuclease (RuvC/YqgF family)
MYRQQLKEVTHSYNKLKIENQALVNEIDSIKREMEELQDQFRLDDADEFRQLQAELEIATKNCRIFQFKLRKLEKRNDTLEADKVLLHGMCGAAVREQSNMPFHLFFIALIPL